MADRNVKLMCSYIDYISCKMIIAGFSGADLSFTSLKKNAWCATFFLKSENQSVRGDL